MVWVRFESIYTEIDRFGNYRRLENRFEAHGTAQEVCKVLGSVMNRFQLLGTKPLGLPYTDDDDYPDDEEFYLPYRRK